MTRLRLWGRSFDGFRRAVAAHGRAWAGGEVEATWFDLPELEARVLGRAGRAGHAARHAELTPDLFVVPADWLPALAAAGRVRPLTAMLASAPPEGWPDAWPESFRQGLAWDGEIFGLPFHGGPQLLFVRPDLLVEVGRPTPRTWSELVDTARALHAPGRCGTVLAGAPDGHNNVYDFVLQLWRHGGDLTAEDTDGALRVTLDTAPARAALAFLRDVATTVVSERAHELDSTASGEEFAAGRAGVSVNWAGYAALAAAHPARVDFSCTVAPTHDDGTPTVTVNAFWVIAVSSDCPDPDRAYDYLRHSASPAMDRATTEAGACGVRRDTWADPGVRAARPESALFDEAYRHSRPLPRIPQLPALVGVLDELVDAVVWRGAPADAALAVAQRAADDLTTARPLSRLP